MNNLFQHKEKFDAWLNHEMSESERIAFEAELETNPQLKAEFLAHQQLINDIKDAAEYAEIRSTLRSIHNKPGVVNKHFFRSPQFITGISIAAGLALLFTIVNPFVKEGNESLSDDDYQYLKYEQPAAAEEMSNQVAPDTISNFVAELTDDGYSLNLKPDTTTRVNTAPAGTAFLISDKGFFLTSKHLVNAQQVVLLQSKERGMAFQTRVVYMDSLSDFAILQCHSNITSYFDPVPYRFLKTKPALGQDVFTLGYPKKEIVYTKGVISSEKGYKSDSLSFEVSLPSNPGYSGAPLFTYEGDLAGIVTANNNKQQSVTYVIQHHYIERIITSLEKNDSMNIDMKTNFTRRYKDHSNLVKAYRSYIFEVHP